MESRKHNRTLQEKTVAVNKKNRFLRKLREFLPLIASLLPRKDRASLRMTSRDLNEAGKQVPLKLLQTHPESFLRQLGVMPPQQMQRFMSAHQYLLPAVTAAAKENIAAYAIFILMTDDIQQLDKSRVNAVLIYLAKEKFPQDLIDGISYTKAYLHKGKQEYSKLSLANVIRAVYHNLSGADLSLIGLRDLQFVKLTNADLRQLGSISNFHLQNADLRGAHLENLNLRNAHLKGANLRGARLHNADIFHAELQGANMREVYLDNIKNLLCAQLKGAVITANEKSVRPVHPFFQEPKFAAPQPGMACSKINYDDTREQRVKQLEEAAYEEMQYKPLSRFAHL
jgi:uncharacterized protein YjbI with pentapeptide repeats